MTNREALKAKVAQPAPKATIDLEIIEQGLQPEEQYDPTREDNRKGIDLAQAGLLFWICTNPKAVKELDYQITQHEIVDLLRLRSMLLKRWGIPDESAIDGPTIESVSDLW